MNNLIIPLLLLSPLINATEYNYKIIRIVDGDTVVIEAPYLPKPLKPEISLRIDGVDTPEKDFRAKCKNEDDLAHAATKFTTEKLQNSKSYKIDIKGEDKYFRLLGDIIIDGEKLSELLIKNNLAREYHGERKESWCTLF